MSKKINIIGVKFNKLTVIKEHEKKNSSKDCLYECLCDCGNIKITTSGALRNNLTQSCGCYNSNIKHGDWNLRIRRIWVNMKKRCCNINNPQYLHYGGRGIFICDEWLNYFVFKQWSYENGYNDFLTIERLDNNMGYSPKNCKWATYKEQANNKRSNHFITHNGKTKTISQWADFYNINQIILKRRLGLGWSFIDAATKPILENRISKRYRK
jgi:hypothetical protein